MKWLKAVRSLLGKITDALMWGRQRGLWSEKQGTGGSGNVTPFERPHRPDGIVR